MVAFNSAVTSFLLIDRKVPEEFNIWHCQCFVFVSTIIDSSILSADCICYNHMKIFITLVTLFLSWCLSWHDHLSSAKSLRYML